MKNASTCFRGKCSPLFPISQLNSTFHHGLGEGVSVVRYWDKVEETVHLIGGVPHGVVVRREEGRVVGVGRYKNGRKEGVGWRWEEEVGGLTVFEEGGWQLLMYRLEGGRTRAVVKGEEGGGQGVVVTGWDCQEGILVPRYEVDKQKIEKIELITEFPHTVAEEDRIKYQLVKLKNIELEEEDRRTDRNT